jgi:hypothetical protein
MELNRRKGIVLYSRRFILALLVIVTAVLASCKVSYSFSGASIPPAAKTFSVLYFQNRAQLVQVGLSQSLTDALIDKCKSQTSLNYVTETGDMSFEGEITDYNTRPSTVGSNDRAASNRFTISVKVKFTNNIDPTFNFEQVFSNFEDYDSNLDLSRVEKDLSDKIIEKLVEDIFNKAFVNW